LLLGAMVAYPLLGVPDVWRMQLAYLPLMALFIWAFGAGAGLCRAGCRGKAGWCSWVMPLLRFIWFICRWCMADWRYRIGWVMARCHGAWAGVVSLVAIALSVAVYRWVEVPVIGWLRPRIDGWFAR
jgi:hypothetical protein